MRTKNNVVEQTSVPLDGIFTKDFASFLVNHSNTIFSTDKETDKTIARAFADGHEEIPRYDPGLSRLNLEESDAVNLPKISYVKETWNSTDDSEKFALIKEYTEFLMAFREGEKAIGFPKYEDGTTEFPSGFAGFLKRQIGNESKRQDLHSYWSNIKEKNKDSLIEKYCTEGRDHEANKRAIDEIATSYDVYRSIEGIERAKKAMSNAIEGVGVIQDTEPSSFSDWIPSPSSIAKTVFPFITASLFGAGAAAAEPNSESASAARQPTRQPTRQPSEQPSEQPTGQPTGTPTGQPSETPKIPTLIPSTKPTVRPSMLPSLYQKYTQKPTSPSGHPTGQPTAIPSFKFYNPNFEKPTRKPTGQPTGNPSGQPTGEPTWTPTTQPSGQPSTYLRVQNPSNSKDAGLSNESVAGIALAGVVAFGGVIYCINRFTRPSSQPNIRGNHTQLANNDNDKGERL